MYSDFGEKKKYENLNKIISIKEIKFIFKYILWFLFIKIDFVIFIRKFFILLRNRKFMLCIFFFFGK